MTIIEKTIGTGATYATPTAWEAAKPADLVAATTIWKGLLFSGVYAGAVTFTGSTTDATYYPWLIAAPGHEYDPATGQGALMTADNASVLTISEIGARVEGVGFRRTTGTGSVVNINAASVILRRCVAICTDALVVGDLSGYLRSSGSPVLTHCVAIGGGVNNQAMSVGFNGNAGSLTTHYCLAWNVKGGAGNAYGFDGCTAVNCVSLASRTADYNGGSVATCAASDATGAPNDLDSLTAATILEAPATFDFRPRKVAAPNTLINTGTPIAGVVQDFRFRPIDATPDVGIYQLTPTPPQSVRYGEGRELGRDNPWHHRIAVKSRA